MRILIVKLSSMGDVLHALPTAAALKRQTGAELHWAVHPAFAQLVRCFACVDKVLEIPRKSGLSGFRKAAGLLRETEYDWIVDLQGLFKSAVVARTARLSRGGRRVGPSFHRELSGLFYSAVPKLVKPRRHAVEECLDVLPLLGLERPAEPEFAIRPPEVELPDGPVFRVAIAPVSRWKTRDWPVESFAAAARSLHDGHGAEIHILGGPADRDVAEAIGRLSGVPVWNHCGEYDVPHSCGLLKRMDCLLTNDSGPMHLAAAVGTRCVAVFGPTNPERTGPYGARHIVLQSGVCPPCHSRECKRGDIACMASVTPEMAVRAVERCRD